MAEKLGSLAEENCAQSLIEMHRNHFVTVVASLNELLQDQNAVVQTIHQESDRIVNSEGSNHEEELRAMTQKTRIYLEKVNKLKAEMASISQKMDSIKERAIRLQNETVSDMVKKEEDRNKKREFEKKLIAKPVKPHPS